MDAYFDSAIIVKLYVREVSSHDAVRLVARHRAPYVLTPWQALEVKNAMRLKAFRAEITVAEMLQSITAFEQDIATGRWHWPACPTAAVEAKAEELSAAFSAILGCRTLDILHVAAAFVIGVKEFVTFDTRQGTLANRIGFTVKP